MPPIVYIIPPIKSHKNAGWLRDFTIGLKANIQVQPIAIYMADESHFGLLTQKAVIITPTIARVQIKISNLVPILLFNAIDK